MNAQEARERTEAVLKELRDLALTRQRQKEEEDQKKANELSPPLIVELTRKIEESANRGMSVASVRVADDINEQAVATLIGNTLYLHFGVGLGFHTEFKFTKSDQSETGKPYWTFVVRWLL